MTAVLLLTLLAHPQPPQSGDRVLGPPLRRTVAFESSVGCSSAGGKGCLRDVEVRVAIPEDGDHQTVRNLVCTPEPAELTTDVHGNRIAIFRVDRVDPEDPFRFGWTAEVETRRISLQPDRSRLKGLDAVPAAIRRAYLGDGSKYRLGDPDLRKAAALIREQATDPWDLAFRTNEYVRERLTYRNDGRWEDAAAVHRNRHGSCSEYNFLFMALARINGLPARYVGATALRSRDPEYHDTVHHRWTEVYLPGFGWYPVDVSRNDGEDGKPINQSFGRTSDRLLILMKGDGGSTPLAWSYIYAWSSRRVGDAVRSTEKVFIWRDPSVIQTGE